MHLLSWIPTAILFALRVSDPYLSGMNLTKDQIILVSYISVMLPPLRVALVS
jgi:hypothetical protein